jgi:hypothetical protein
VKSRVRLRVRVRVRGQIVGGKNDALSVSMLLQLRAGLSKASRSQLVIPQRSASSCSARSGIESRRYRAGLIDANMLSPC